jgi:hypothetical protein
MDMPEGSRFCARCGLPLTKEALAYSSQQLNAAAQRQQNSITFGAYLLTDAGQKAFHETLEFFKSWVAEAAQGYRNNLWAFAIVIGVFVGGLIALGLTRTLNSAVATVFGVLIGFVLAKMPGGSGGGGSTKN